MGINFPDGSQYYPTSTIQTKQQLYSTVESYSADRTVFQDIMTCTMTARSNISKLLVYIEVHGYNNSSGMDRSFRAMYKVDSGSYIAFGNNPNTYSGMIETYIGNCRGDDHLLAFGQPMMFLIDNNWSDGNVLTVKLSTIGEDTFYLNQNSQTGDNNRFGRGRTRIILREEIGEPS
tara:strand:- start:265 stop:792 length:528 start_codon:yes stop_codon:yes gene_type:complete